MKASTETADLDAVAITFDVDWAPDWAVDRCRDICERYEAKATFFVTHESRAVTALRSHPVFELGIHPNFLTGSTHGDTPAEVMDYCLALVPDARSMRTHSLVQSSPLFAFIAENYPQIDTDVSLLLPGHPNLQPVDLYYGRSQRRITRCPYYWEDDEYAVRPRATWRSGPDPGRGLRIYAFHPSLVCLNLNTLHNYWCLKAALEGRPLSEASEEDFEPYASEGEGARTFLESLIRTTGPSAFSLISEITGRHREAHLLP